MSDLLKNFGMYDIMGVWAPGSISLLYILFTIICIHNIDIISILKGFQSDFSIMFIFVFCILAYCLGVVYHEIGKAIHDLKPPFTFHTLLKLRNKKHLNVFIKRFITLTSTECCPFENLNMTVYDALELVKRKNANISSIEKSRSIYGFSRSLMISFVMHIFYCVFMYVNRISLIRLFGLQIYFFIALFLFRTIRYYYIWIQKTLNCYATINIEEKTNEYN